MMTHEHFPATLTYEAPYPRFGVVSRHLVVSPSSPVCISLRRVVKPVERMSSGAVPGYRKHGRKAGRLAAMAKLPVTERQWSLL